MHLFISVIAANKASRIHDGTTTNRQDYTAPASRTGESKAQYQARVGQASLVNGLHESFDYYDDCNMRARNRGIHKDALSARNYTSSLPEFDFTIPSHPLHHITPPTSPSGLFTADQNLANNNLGISSAAFTRQNANGNRRGYECPEERDYYPYWHPSPWVDVAILTDDVSRCRYYQAESFNVKPKGLCRQMFNDGGVRPWSEFNTYSTCIANGGTFSMRCVECAYLISD